MVKRSGKHKQMYVDHPRGLSKQTCLIHVPGHSPDKCKVLIDFGTKYAKVRNFKEFRQDTKSNKNLKKSRDK